MTENVTSVKLAYAEEEMQQTNECPEKYQVKIPAKKVVGLYASDFGLASAIKKFTTEYLKYLLSESQLARGRRSAMMVTGPFL